MPKKPDLPKSEYSDNVLKIFREILSGAQLDDVKFADELKGPDRVNFLKFCSQTVSNPWFATAFNEMYWLQAMKVGTEGDNFDKVTFNRATGNGISFVKEFFEKYSRIYTAEFENKPMPFDPHKRFSPLNNV